VGYNASKTQCQHHEPAQLTAACVKLRGPDRSAEPGSGFVRGRLEDTAEAAAVIYKLYYSNDIYSERKRSNLL